jgi:DHA1 family multidrug resistance protein-like MFS transporter
VGGVIFAVGVAAFSRIPLLPEIGRDLSLTAGEIGLMITAFGLGRLAMDLPAGRLSDVFPSGVALTGAGVVLAVACALLAISGSLVEALLASALIGCASALTNTTGMYAFATATPAGRRGASMAIYTTALMSGQMVGPALGGAIGTLAGWRPATWVAAGIGVIVAIVCAGWVRHVHGSVAWRRAAPRRGDEPPLATKSEPPAPAPPRLQLIALAAAPFATFFGLAGLTQTLIPLIGDGELGFSASTIGLAVGAGAASRFLSAWVAGIASDRYSRRAVLVPSLLLMALGAAFLALPPSTAAWLAAIVLLALGSSGIAVAAAAVADVVPARRLGHELGLFRLVGDLGLLSGPIVAAFIYQESGPQLAGAAAAGVFGATALAAALWVREPRRVAEGARPRRDDSEELLVE